MKIILMVIVIWLILWIVWSYFVTRNLEEPNYSILEKNNEYEVRQYSDYIVAEVEMSWDQSSTLNQWFSLLAWYIFWWNSWGNSIAMTVPVSEKQWQQISMTAPVSNIVTESNTRIVQFSMPSQYNLENLPKPNNDKVVLKNVPWYKAAVLSYTWYATQKRVEEKKKKLLELLITEQKEIIWAVTSAQYNPPLSFPFTRRNEIIVPIK